MGGALEVGGAISNKKKLDETKKRMNAAREEYEKKKKRLDSQQNRTVKTLDKLGKQKLETQKSFQRFADAFEKIKNRPEFRTGREEHYVFAQHELQSLREISLSAVETIAGIDASVTAGTATAAGAYALVGVLGTASTGTAISGLAGAERDDDVRAAHALTGHRLEQLAEGGEVLDGLSGGEGKGGVRESGVGQAVEAGSQVEGADVGVRRNEGPAGSQRPRNPLPAALQEPRPDLDVVP